MFKRFIENYWILLLVGVWTFITVLAIVTRPARADDSEYRFQQLMYGCAQEYPRSPRLRIICQEFQSDAGKKILVILRSGNQRKIGIFRRCEQQWNDGLNGTPDYAAMVECFRIRNAASRG